VHDLSQATRTTRDKHRALRIGPLVCWTVLVWGGRVRNVLADDMESTERAWRLGLAGSFLVLTALVIWSSLVRRDDRPVLALAAWSVGVWAVRWVQITFDPQWGAGFKVVHSVLALVSIGLAAWAATWVASRGTR